MRSLIYITFTAFPFLSLSYNFPSLQTEATLIGQLGENSWAENIAVRSSGELLCTTLSPGPYLYSLTPPSQPVLLANFSSTGKTSLGGIVETSPDHFFVVAGDPPTSLSNLENSLGTFSVFSVNVTAVPATFAKVADVDDAFLLDGLATLSVEKNLLIASDPFAEVIFFIDVVTGVSGTLLNDTTMQSPGTANEPLGINGLRVLVTETPGEVDIYYSNTGKGLICRVRYNVYEMKQMGEVDVLVNGTEFITDDFAVDVQRGVLWLAGDQENAILRVPLDGE
jgi:hypothetical protein